MADSNRGGSSTSSLFLTKHYRSILLTASVAVLLPIIAEAYRFKASHAGASGSERKAEAYVKSLIHQYPEDLPPDVVAELSRQRFSISILEEMLADSTEAAYWPRAVRALGAIAPYSEDLSSKLIEFVEGKAGFCRGKSSFKAGTAMRSCQSETLRVHGQNASQDLSDPEYLARGEALISLGFLIAKKPGSDPSWSSGPDATLESANRAFQYLVSGADPSFWNERVFWTDRHAFETSEERNVFLSSMAIRGIGASCRSERRRELERIGETSGSEPALEEAVKQAASYSESRCRE